MQTLVWLEMVVLTFLVTPAMLYFTWKYYQFRKHPLFVKRNVNIVICLGILTSIYVGINRPILTIQYMIPMSDAWWNALQVIEMATYRLGASVPPFSNVVHFPPVPSPPLGPAPPPLYLVPFRPAAYNIVACPPVNCTVHTTKQKKLIGTFHINMLHGKILDSLLRSTLDNSQRKGVMDSTHKSSRIRNKLVYK